MLTTENASKCVLRTLMITFIIKIVLCLAIPVTGDEAYYAIWGIFPSWGGYDHTPFIGWLLYPFLQLSKNPIILRLPMVITSTVIGGIIYLFLRSNNKEKAALTSIIFLVSPLSVCAVLITTDTPVILFSFLSGICVLQAVRKDDHLGWFTLGGIFLGIAFFSKYFAVLLALSYGVYFLFIAPSRRRLMGLLIIFLCVLPFGIENLYWNYTHAWANILFNVYNRNVQDHFGIGTVITYLLTLFYIFTPPLFYYYAAAFLASGREHEAAASQPYLKALHYFILIPLLFFLLLSARKEIGLHWPLAFIAFVYLWAGMCLNTAALRKTLKFILWFTGAHLIVIFTIVCMPMSIIQKLPVSEKFYTKLVYFFKHKQIRDSLRRYDKDYVFTSLNYVQADMMFYDSGEYAPTFGKGDVHGRQDDLMTDFKKYAHKNFLIFYSRRPRPEEYAPYFATTDVNSFEEDGTIFYYVLGQDFNYPAYRETVLRYINDTYWQIPTWLPHKPSFFCEKYFQANGCR
jgi:hypothetical protein